jgi:hypothetical protein
MPVRLYDASEGEPRIYRIIRFRQNGKRRVVRNNVTLTDAQAHCDDDKTKGGDYARGTAWFDGYDYMPGCRPKEDR